KTIPAPAPCLRAARRPPAPRAAGTRQSRRAKEPLPRRAGRPHEHRGRRAHAARRHRLGPLRRALRLRRRFADVQFGEPDLIALPSLSCSAEAEHPVYTVAAAITGSSACADDDNNRARITPPFAFAAASPPGRPT